MAGYRGKNVSIQPSYTGSKRNVSVEALSIDSENVIDKPSSTASKRNVSVQAISIDSKGNVTVDSSSTGSSRNVTVDSSSSGSNRNVSVQAFSFDSKGNVTDKPTSIVSKRHVSVQAFSIGSRGNVTVNPSYTGSKRNVTVNPSNTGSKRNVTVNPSNTGSKRNVTVNPSNTGSKRKVPHIPSSIGSKEEEKAAFVKGDQPNHTAEPQDPKPHKGAGCFTQFRLLMWKNFLQQMRHPIQTIAEVLVPVLSMTVILIVRSEIEPSWHDAMKYPLIKAIDVTFSTNVMNALEMNKLGLAYSPECPFLDLVMKKAATELYMKNKIMFDVRSNMSTNPIQIYAHKSKSSLHKIYSSQDITRQIIAGVDFQDDFDESKTSHKYYLRFPMRPRQYSLYALGAYNWHTDLLFPRFERPGPRFPFSWEGGNEPGYVNELFIAVQHAVSMSLIEHVSGLDFEDFPVNIQRFPTPPFVIDEAVVALKFLFPMCIMLSFTYSAINIVKAMTVEKELQLKETMKIMGLPTWLHWTAWFVKQFIYLLIIAALIVILIKVHWFRNKLGYTEYAVFTKTSWSVLFIFLTLYLTCTIFFCFMLSNLFSNGSMAALCSGVLWFMSYAPAILLAMDLEVSVLAQIVACLSLNTAMSFGFQMLLTKECVGGIQWGKFMDRGSDAELSFGHVMIMLAVDSMLYMVMALYLEQVVPGPFGSPRPWYYLVQKNYWCPTKDTIPAGELASEQKNIVVEKETINHPIGIKLTRLTKVYGVNMVVNDLNLVIYDNQITILLGHNGAGKSTTMSLLTGNALPTRGSVWLGGYDVALQTEKARANLGFCPQHNVLFEELTVREHLEFFARLKGFTGQQLSDDIDILIKKLELTDKRDYQAGMMSGGQKRRLAVGIALCGAPRVVLLDEPTSGMDPSSRRALWDLLQMEKKGRSMVLTTHFMDEADLLGDRVVIMAHGQLQCVGSPFFLKRFYGVGYTLVVVKDTNFNIDACTGCIKNHIPDIKVKEDRGTEVTYALTNEQSKLFEEMLKDLENNIGNIKFKNYGLAATTLEDVFMSVGSDVVADDTEFEGDISSGNAVVETSCERWAQHVMGVWLKLWLVLTRSWLMLLLQVLVPVLQIILSLGFLSYAMFQEESNHPMSMRIDHDFPTKTETLLSFSGSNGNSTGLFAARAYRKMLSSYSNVLEVENMESYYMKRGNEGMELIRKSIPIGASFTPNQGIAWFSNFGYHDVAFSLAAVHEALFKIYEPGASLLVINLPLEAHYNDQSHIERILDYLSMQLSFGVGNSVAIISAVFIMFYIKERECGAKLLQKSAGIHPVLLWGSAVMFDWPWFLIISLTIVFCCRAFRVLGLTSAEDLGRLYLGFMVYGAAMLPLHYVISLVCDGVAMGFIVMYFMNILFGMMGAQIVHVLSNPMFNATRMADFMDGILQVFPMYSLVRSVNSLNQIGLKDWMCLQSCSQLMKMLGLNDCHKPTLCKYNATACCGRDNPHLEWEEPGILRYLFCMAMTGIFLWVLFMFFEYRIFQKIFNRKTVVPPINWKTLDEDVAKEIKRVEALNKSELSEYSLVARGLTKQFKKHLAVDQISFTVSDAEVFGLLGVNGAGKTTTFRMLMGDESISSGDAFIAGYSVKNDLHNVHQRIGYCPQFDALFNELTGRETLRLFSLFRGLRRDQSATRIDVLAQALGFTKHLDKRVDQYSGGNKRKLSTAVALLGQTRVVFVDEPTTGVDPAAKRQVWRALRAARRAGRGVVLTSHSMEECEALCSRLTVMVQGRFQCLGTPQHLKNRFSEGFTLMIKLKKDQDSKTTDDSINAVKKYVMDHFKQPKIMEEHQNSLTYYLPDRSVAWSAMFGIMERCRLEFDVEDYTISQTTLEQIFLMFARQPHVPTD